MEIPSFPLQNQALRDLYWALYSEPLFAHSSVAEVAVCRSGLGEGPMATEPLALLHAWDRLDSPFLQQIQRQRFRKLGPYFEALIGGWLQHHPAYELVARGQAIREGNRTLGEIDFLYWEKASAKLIHLEVAVKFYLSQGGQTSWDDWVGPNPIDRLDRKWPRMQHHQATLLRQPAGQAWLSAQGLPAPEARVLIKGCLFTHATVPGRVIPDRAYTKHIHGGWLRQHEAAVALTHISPRWQAMPRLNWLAPPPQVKEAELSTVAQVVAQTGKRPQQWRAWPHAADQPGKRVIIVPDHWPEPPPRN